MPGCDADCGSQIAVDHCLVAPQVEVPFAPGAFRADGRSLSINLPGSSQSGFTVGFGARSNRNDRRTRIFLPALDDKRGFVVDAILFTNLL